MSTLFRWCLPGHITLCGFLLCASLLAADDRPVVADAAEAKDTAAIARLLQQGADVNAAQADGMTALHWAAYHDDLAAAQLLIAHKANVQVTNRYQVTPLALACTNGKSEMVEALLSAGADANGTLAGGETPLMIAARTGRLAPVKQLIAAGAKVDAAEVRGQTALMWAAAEGHAQVVQELLGAGADPQRSLSSGFNSLFFAAREGRREVVKILLAAGMDVNQTITARKATPRSASPGTSALILAIENGHFELAVELLEAGADPNDQRSGYTPLHILTWVRKPNRGDGEDGDPPPRGSGRFDSLDFVRALVAHGADVNSRLERGPSGRGVLSRRGATPFLLAAMTADVPLMRTLVELGADPSIANSDGSTPLMAAAGLGTLAPGEVAGTEDEALEAVVLAIELGNDLNAVDAHGETAMHGAAYKSFPRVVQLLADRGAKIEVWNRKNEYGWTPLLIAEGFRPGNFRPSSDTIAAIHRVMVANGLTPPAPTPRETAEAYAPASGVR